MATAARPFARTINPFVERWVAGEQQELHRELRVLATSLEGLDGPGPLLRDTGKRLVELIKLESCVVYARAGDAYTPLYAAGPVVPMSLAAEGALARLANAADAPISRNQWRSWVKRGAIDSIEGAALETLDVHLILPLRRDNRLFAILCLGESDAGDDYGAMDTMLLEALANRMSAELDRYDADLLESQERLLMAQLQDYVPVKVVEEIQRGGNVELGDVEISILFVDMRDYTSISAGLSDAEIFELTNEYTAAVSEEIQHRGGVVVEFQGDGLMAVFGAPNDLDGKETLAVAAACDASRVVASDRFTRRGHSNLRVGVGIATGTAFVGTIQSAGQKVWSAMGNNVNLAARLEGLTKTLDASLVLDATTFDRLGAGQEDFRCEEGVSLKGRDVPIDVYYLPIIAGVDR